MSKFASSQHRKDGNHDEIVTALRAFPGIALQSLTGVGKGCPDLLVAFRGTTVLLEVKQPGEKPNAAQIEFMASWPGKVYVVSDGDEAVRVVVEAARPGPINRTTNPSGCCVCETVCMCGGMAGGIR